MNGYTSRASAPQASVEGPIPGAENSISTQPNAQLSHFALGYTWRNSLMFNQVLAQSCQHDTRNPIHRKVHL